MILITKISKLIKSSYTFVKLLEKTSCEQVQQSLKHKIYIHKNEEKRGKKEGKRKRRWEGEGKGKFIA